MRLFKDDRSRNLLRLLVLLPTLSSASVLPSGIPDIAITHGNDATDPISDLLLTRPPSAPAKPLPLLIWHGLGDRFDAEGLHSVGGLAQQIHPGTYVHYISVVGADEGGSADRTASFFGNVSAQIDEVCEVLKADPRLWRREANAGNDEANDGERDAPTYDLRVDALGFSQGGQFLRGLFQRCEALSVRSLVTFGSQHNGIAQFQHCGTWDFVCKGASALVKGNVWTDAVQGRVVPAQYFREMNETTGFGSDEYLENSHFLADINNEKRGALSPDDGNGKGRSEEYKRKIESLEKFVMFVFEEDTTVIPTESGWFGDVNMTSGQVTELRNRTLYKEDWLGLKALDKKGGLVFRSTPGRHMALDEEILTETFRDFFGPESGEKLVVEGYGAGLSVATKKTLGFFSRVWNGFWSWIDNGAMVAPPHFAINAVDAPKDVL